jgi:pilus assembly protein CpaE
MAVTKQQRIVLVSNDKELVQATKSAFAAFETTELVTIDKHVTELTTEVHLAQKSVVIIDMDTRRLEEIESLQRLMRRMEALTTVIVVAQEFDAAAVRILMQLRVADFLVKPISTADLVRSCLRALKGVDETGSNESQVFTFMPVAGGVGNTTIALETAFLLHNSAVRGASTCVVDLNFQQGVCAEYLDLEPRFDITEIENQPERLDRRLLDVMLSKHASGLSVLAAPVQPTEMRSFNADVVIRMLDLVSAYFDNVVIDMPRTWFPWTEAVLLGSNKLFLVTEMTVPCLRHTQRLIKAIDGTVGKQIKPSVIVNRFEKRMFESGIRQADVEDILGDHFVGGISNNYRLVREAVDRGVPLHTLDKNSNVVNDLKRIILPEEMPAAVAQKRSLMSIGRSLLKKAG